MKSMRILLCNKFYYRRGGDCIYTMNVEQMLRAHGHSVAVFSQQYPLNEPSEWQSYWPSEFKMKPSPNMVDSLLRPFGLGSVVKRFTNLLDDFQPDVVHLNNIHTQLSPILAELAHRRGIRVVWTIHDTKLVCPCYTCQREGQWCEECLTNKKAVITHRCMPGGLLGAYIGYLEAQKWTPARIQECVDTFICPSRFMADTLLKGGFREEKIHILSNFVEKSKVQSPQYAKDDFYIYVGRISEVKGLRTLCRVAASLPHTLHIVGSGEIEEELKQQYSGYPQIKWQGQMNWESFRPLLEKARFMVLPAEWSENNPLSILESLSLGTPVLGSNIGGIPELITEDNGETFEAGNSEDLRQSIERMWNRQDFDYSAISRTATTMYADEAYYEKLIQLYQD